ncbi:ATP-binding protein (plasmid) [Lactobacillus sp. PV037]|uniref:ATP-binding protein n=1 Tax=unclassified Lactobacillus TaxID=2620435 RepID=UPI0022403CDB|nr:MULTISPECIES: ATP-binding protein [unclassified Lactobacillus]QNQ82916.1 ATP-binding protein [Lactobacillus sp. PV012]QNQ83020.1 ATP-binding protein [Lactobacillus sp. PV037]
MKNIEKVLTKPEDEYHDFKQQWYSSNDKSEFIKDIFSFVNTVHHEDCYLIIGVDDDRNIVGVEDDENRLNTQKITDYLHQLPIANSQVPKVVVETLTIENHEIDIIVIKDTSDVPVYLTEDKHPKGSRRPIHAGQIFVRENDTNTPINKSASDYQVERLWKKRFGLELPIKEKYRVKLKDIGNWEYFGGDEPRLLYTIDPDYCIYIKDEEIARDQVQSYSLGQSSSKVHWSKILLQYKNNTIFDSLGVYMDKFRFFTVVPILGVVPPNEREVLTFQYFIRESYEYLLEQLFISKKHYELSPDYFEKEKLFQRVVIFDNQAQKNKVLEELSRKKDSIKEKCIPTKEELNQCNSLINFDFGTNAYEAQEEYIYRLCKEAKVSEFINEYLKENKLGSISNK